MTFGPRTLYTIMYVHDSSTHVHKSVFQVAPDRPCIIIVVPYEFGPAPRLISVSGNHYQALIGLPCTLGTFNDIVRFANSQNSWPSLHCSRTFTTVLKRFSRQITRRLHRCFRMVLLFRVNNIHEANCDFLKSNLVHARRQTFRV